MLGYNSPTETMFWIQTHQAAKVQYRYKPLVGATDYQRSEAFFTEQSTAFTAKMLLKNLKPNTVYQYQVVLNDSVIQTEKPFTFRTQPSDSLYDLKVVTGSCANINDKSLPTSAKRMIGQAWGYSIFKNMAKRKPDYMVWLGDNIYLRNNEWNSTEGFNYRYTHTRSLKEMQPLLRATNHLATWDDHDYGANNGDMTNKTKDLAAAAFQQFWANPSTHPQNKGGIYFDYQAADVHFFLTDDRFSRSPYTQANNKNKAFLGKEQLDWLLKGLRESKANFKLVCIGTQVLSDNQMVYAECYGKHYPTEWKYLMDKIAEYKIEGVFFLSGDIHHSVLSKYQRPDCYPLYDLTVSAFTSFFNPFFATENGRKVQGTFYPFHNFAELSFTGNPENRKMIITLRSKQGWRIWRKVIPASRLKMN